MDQPPNSTPDSPTSHPEEPDQARWRVLDRRTTYESAWVNVHVDDVELPDGERLAHHVLDFPKGSVGAVFVDNLDRILLIWRHRFITDTWGWEVPAGWIDAGEEPDTAIQREIEEETGYSAGRITRMVDYYPLAGISTQHYFTYVASEPNYLRNGQGVETSRLEWFPIQDVPSLARAGLITDGPSLLILSYYLGVYTR